MPSTVLSILQQAAGEMGIPEPSAYNTNNQLLRLLYLVNRKLRASRAFPQQKRSHTITTSSGRTKYPLPEDFYAGLLGSQYDDTNNWELIGPISDGEFNYLLYGPGSGASLRRRYRVFGPDFNQGSATAGGQFNIYPSPSSTDSLKFDYISRTTILPPAWTASTAITINHYRNANGNIYQATVGGTTSSTPPSHTSGTAADGTVTWTYITAPKETATVDGDLCLFDDDVLIEGLKYVYKEAKGLDFSTPQREFNRMISNSAARWIGNIKGRLDGGRMGNRGRYTTTSGGWSF